MIWNWDELTRVPTVYPAEAFEMPGVNALFYEGLEYEGKPTRAFAYYALPDVKTGEQVPGMVLVHGGGGTAFPEWVRLWADRGYAAIAMDVEGHIPGEKKDNQRPRHEWGGPSRQLEFQDYRRPVQEQWMYHAVADVILAHTLLRSFDGVDEARIGLHGISWGGIVSSIVSGVDDRFSFAIPVYGCGYLYETKNKYGNSFRSMESADAEKIKQLWDPSSHLPNTQMSTLWINSTEDQHFSLDITTKSAQTVKGSSQMTIHPGMKHGHAHGWAPPEIYAFANQHLRQGQPLPQIKDCRNENGRIEVAYVSPTFLQKAELWISENVEDWYSAVWTPITMETDEKKAWADLPGTARAYFANLTDSRGLTVSTAVYER